ncbi:hypothetical protein ILYODFUR_033384 [Ilyodon furcidens]|uniref:Uncharacterized protein n=1 Tax=Ilyodon furcidens TaxID=33524 RepID=A0ABV0UM72_9TELE
MTSSLQEDPQVRLCHSRLPPFSPMSGYRCGLRHHLVNFLQSALHIDAHLLQHSRRLFHCGECLCSRVQKHFQFSWIGRPRLHIPLPQLLDDVSHLLPFLLDLHCVVLVEIDSLSLITNKISYFYVM